jgi:hypothetical protein
MNKLEEIEKEYSQKLEEAKKNENYNTIIMLLYDLKTLRKIYKKK